MGTPALQVQNLTKAYDSGPPVVEDLSFEIRPGEIFGLLGPNGAGKSTTINTTCGVTRLQKGSIRVFGHDIVKEFRTTRRLIGVMHQEIILDNFFKINRSLQLHPGFFGEKDDPVWREELIDRLALRPHLDKTMIKLSGGTKRRFMMAKAMIHRPKLLILDEPTAGVDVELRRSLWDFVREINAKGTTILLTTHYLEEAEQMCDRIGIMNHGKLVALDSTENLMSQWNHQLIRLSFERPFDCTEDNLTLLKDFKPRVLDNGLKLEFCVSDQKATPQILEKINHTGIPIKKVEIQSPRLEDVFIGITSQSPDNGFSQTEEGVV